MPSLRTILLIAVFLLGIAWVVTFIATGQPNLILAIATMGSGLGLAVLSMIDANKKKSGGEGE
jgi:apolipoprotein N-acyltransferase